MHDRCVLSRDTGSGSRNVAAGEIVEAVIPSSEPPHLFTCRGIRRPYRMHNYACDDEHGRQQIRRRRIDR